MLMGVPLSHTPSSAVTPPRRLSPLWTVCVLVAAFFSLATPSSAAPAAAAPITKPPMGWNSWNSFAGTLDHTVIEQQADAIVSSGMKDAGYEYVNIDDGRWTGARDASRNLTVD